MITLPTIVAGPGEDPAQKNVTMRASQYNKLRVASGLEPVDGTDGYGVDARYLISRIYWQDSLANVPKLTITRGHKLHAGGGTLNVLKHKADLLLCQQWES